MTASRKLSLYLKGVSAGTGAMLVNLTSGLAGLWLMTHILDKESYGVFALAQTWILFVSLLSTLGLDRTLMYRVAALERVEDRLAGGDLATTILLMVLLSSALFAGIAWAVVEFLTTIFSFEPFWFVVFIVTVPFSALVTVLIAWQTANDRAHVAQILAPAQSVIRVLLLIAAWMIWPDDAGVATAIIGASVLSAGLWLLRIPSGSFGSFMLPSREDCSYGLKLLFTRVAYDGIVRIDLIMLGIFMSASTVAEYSVAKRLAELAQVGNRLMAPIFTPRMRYALATGDTDGLSHEYRQNRFVTAFAALSLLAVYYLFGQSALDLFGDYRGAWPILLVLVGGYSIRSLYGATGRYLNMAGYANLSLYTTLGLLISNVVLNALTIPVWGAIGAALSTITAMLLTTSTIAYLIWKLDRFQTLSLALAGSVTAVVLAAFSWIILPGQAPLIMAIGIGLAAILFLSGERYVAKTLLLSGRDFATAQRGSDK